MIIAVDALGSDPITVSALLFTDGEEEPVFTYKDGRIATRQARFFREPEKVPKNLYGNLRQYLLTRTLSRALLRLRVCGHNKTIREGRRLEYMSLAVVRCLERYYVDKPVEHDRDSIQVFVPGKDYLPARYLGNTTQIRYADSNWQVGAARLLALVSEDTL